MFIKINEEEIRKIIYVKKKLGPSILSDHRARQERSGE